MSRRNALRIAVSCVLFACFALTGAAAPGEPIPWPTLRIPKIAAPPEIDGKIGEEEWAGAAVITGFHPVYLEETHSVWQVAYDDEWLYLAMHSPHYKGTWPAAKGKPNPAGDSSLGWDAHVEVLLSQHPRQKAFQKGFYIIHANPRDAMRDQHYNWMPGQAGLEWQCERRVKSTVSDDHWDLEMALRRASMTEKPFDGAEWILHLVRADGFAGNHFFAWKYSWYLNCHEFPAVVFDPDAPSFRFLRLGEVRKGDLNAVIELVGRGQKPREIDVTVRAVGRKDKKAVHEQTQSATVGAGQRRRLTFQQRLQFPEGGLDIEVRAYMKSPDGPVVLYEQRIPDVRAWTDADEQARREEIERRKNLVTTMNYNFAYYPSIGLGRAFVDNDVFGMPERITSARAFRVRVFDAQNRDKPVASARGGIDGETLFGEVPIPLPDLPEGQYVAVADLIGPGGKLVDKQSVSFARAAYPWEGNEIGEEHVVIPPFTPLAVRGSKILPWGRTYEIGPDGLPRRIVHGRDNLLREPMRVESSENDKEVRLVGRGAEIRPADREGHTVRVEAQGTIGSVPVEIRGEMIYDGFYLLTLEMKPAKPTTLDGLELVMPCRAETDTAYIKRSDSLKGSYVGAFPDGEGAVWDSRALGCDPRWGTFVPLCFVGTADKGIVWEAETDAGWNADPQQPCVVLERSDGNPQLRIRIFHGPTRLAEPRSIRFAVWAAPTKPMRPDWRRVAWCYPELQVAWDVNAGYRRYGNGVNSFVLPSDEHYLKLRQTVATPGARTDKSKYHRWWWLNQPLSRGKPLILYGSDMGTGMAMPELETYAGEWLGRAWPEGPSPEEEKGEWNLQETIQWNEPRQLSAAFVNVCDSYVDCYVWYHQKYVRLTGLQGNWWDNASLFTVWTPEPGTGRRVYRWNNFLRRHFHKRLATMCWLAGREPWWVECAGGMQLSFNTISAQVEGDFYLPADTTLYEYLPMDRWRGLLAVRRGTIPMLWPQWKATTKEHHRSMARSIDAVRLLHDIGAHPLARADQTMLKLLDTHAGLFDDARDIEFIGYWRSDAVARFDAKDKDAQPPYISLYRNTRRGRTLVVIANPNAEPLTGFLWLNRPLLIGNPLDPGVGPRGQLMDVEANRLVSNIHRGDLNWWIDHRQWNAEQKRYEDDLMVLPALDHRLLVLE